MPAKRNVKTSKTDHVLNILTSPAPGGENEENAPGTQKKPVPPVIEVANSKNEEISSAIDSALRQGLDDENVDAQENSEASSSPDLQAQQSEDAPKEAPPAALDENEAEKQSEEAQETAAPQVAQEQSEQPKEENTQDEDVKSEPQEQTPQENIESASKEEQKQQPDTSGIFVNVMEEIVDELKQDYAKKFKMCQCERCLSDVKAYSLSNLPAKYVVLSSSTVIPMMGFYRSRYETLVKSKLIVACKIVSDSPRHGDGFRNSY